MTAKLTQKDCQNEVWKQIPDFKGFYEASSLGRIRRVDKVTLTRNQWGTMLRPWKGRILKPHKNPNTGYRGVSLSRGGAVAQKLVHRLVAAAFHGRCPPKHQCAHLDGTRDNNKADNLRWVTPKENQEHRRLHGRANFGDAAHQAILCSADVIEIRKRRSAGEIYRTIAEDYGVHLSTIQYAVSGKNWRYVKEG